MVSDGLVGVQAPSVDSTATRDLSHPPGRPSGLGFLLTLRVPAYWAARIGIKLAGYLGRPLRLRGTVVVVRHRDVAEALARDLDFCIEPVNAPKFEQIGYRFILGMDRSAELTAERRILYAALAKVDVATLRMEAEKEIASRLAASPGTIDVVEDYARPVAAATASRLFGIAPADKASFMDAARAVFGNSFLNVDGDKAMSERAMIGANLLSDWFEAEIARRSATGRWGGDLMGMLLAAGATPDLTRRTLGGMLVGAIDTTATAVAKVMTVLMTDKGLLERAMADRADPRLMWGWCNEALRRWAHGPILVRTASCDTILAGTRVRAGDSVILWTQAAMLDPGVFPEPHTLKPDRTDAPYLHLGGGLHPCAGRGINAWQIPLLVAALLDRQPVRLGRMGWAGPFPAHLPIDFAGSAP